MPDKLEAELNALSALTSAPREEATARLRTALSHRSNLIVARAAKIAAQLELTGLTTDLATVFQHFLESEDPAKRDPQCWAKNELSKALAKFEFQSPELFLRGMNYVQMEPVWGGAEDSAAALRGTCALALVQCREVRTPDLLRHLIPLFRDPVHTVQVNAARAVEQTGSDTAALLLRLRAELGAAHPELLAACLGGVLRIDGVSALPWVAAFIRDDDDVSTEAAFVLSEHRTPEAFAALRAAYETVQPRLRLYPDLRETLFAAAAAMRLEPATAWLLAFVTADTIDAKAAAAALWSTHPDEALQATLTTKGHPRPGK